MHDATKYVLWLVPAAGFAVMLVRIALQRRGSEHAVFFVYGAAVILATIGQLSAYFSSMSYSAYFTVFWASEAILLLIGCSAIAEALLDLLSRYKVDFRIAVVLGVLVGSVVTGLAILSVGHWKNTFVQTVLAFQNAARFVQMAALFFALLLAIFLHLRWKKQTFSILFGFGFYGSMQALLMALTRRQVLSPNVYSVLDPLVYCVVTAFWGACLDHPERQPVARVLPTTQIKQWNQALGELLHR